MKMKMLASMIAVLALGFAGCTTETQTTTTTTRTNQRTSATDTTALDQSRNTNMQPSSYNSMGSTPR
jgi:PBP1b-binding outer membrane lipoprotein LpoB